MTAIALPPIPSHTDAHLDRLVVTEADLCVSCGGFTEATVCDACCALLPDELVDTIDRALQLDQDDIDDAYERITAYFVRV
jgi:hypothetical protein